MNFEPVAQRCFSGKCGPELFVVFGTHIGQPVEPRRSPWSDARKRSDCARAIRKARRAGDRVRSTSRPTGDHERAYVVRVQNAFKIVDRI